MSRDVVRSSIVIAGIFSCWMLEIGAIRAQGPAVNAAHGSVGHGQLAGVYANVDAVGGFAFVGQGEHGVVVGIVLAVMLQERGEFLYINLRNGEGEVEFETGFILDTHQFTGNYFGFGHSESPP